MFSDNVSIITGTHVFTVNIFCAAVVIDRVKFCLCSMLPLPCCGYLHCVI